MLFGCAILCLIVCIGIRLCLLVLVSLCLCLFVPLWCLFVFV